MSQAKTVRRSIRHAHTQPGTLPTLLKGLGVAMLVTICGIALFALLMQWIRPSDTVIRVFNQLLKLASITAGVAVASPRGGSVWHCMLLGLIYMLLGIVLYALQTGQDAPITAYLADIGMGVACGGLVGMLRR